MYLYLYDNFLNSAKYNKVLANIETRLTDMGIGGKISRLSPLKNIKELIHDEVANGVNTIVAVGNDKTVIEIINDIADLDITLGIIPIGPDNSIAHSFGIRTPEDASAILSARKLEKIDLGKINNIYFLSNIIIRDGNTVLQCEQKYKIVPRHKNHEIHICNFRPQFMESSSASHFNPYDGHLEAVIRPMGGIASPFLNLFGDRQTQCSIIPFKKITVTGENSEIKITDGQKILKTPAKISVVPKKLKVIVGKKRIF